MIKTLINAISKKKALVSKGERFESGNFSSKSVMSHEDDRFDGGIEKELVGYELHKLPKNVLKIYKYL